MGQTDPAKINVLDVINFNLQCRLGWSVLTLKICSDDAISENLNELTCENVIHELDVMINDIVYRSKMNVNNLLNYSGENNTCSELQSLEDIVDPIRKTTLMMKQYIRNQLRIRKQLSHLELFTFLWCSSKRQGWNFLM